MTKQTFEGLLTGERCLTSNERGGCRDNSGAKSEYGSKMHDGEVKNEKNSVCCNAELRENSSE